MDFLHQYLWPTLRETIYIYIKYTVACILNQLGRRRKAKLVANMIFLHKVYHRESSVEPLAIVNRLSMTEEEEEAAAATVVMVADWDKLSNMFKIVHKLSFDIIHGWVQQILQILKCNPMETRPVNHTYRTSYHEWAKNLIDPVRWNL